MMLLESPAVTDGLRAWEAWVAKLDKMPARDRADRTVIAERKRAMKVIYILQKYPQGLDARSPNFRQVVRELSAA
ncbi:MULTISPECIES: hypothetical protein [pseudomallei group]|uniref:hypothetical protein n=1 Tax=pseudomallei group TaxID=111527 RepID=UPI00050E8615|nr:MULTISPECIES: hypothetical protein [pseudomallei group]KGC30005.1 hypothetical protein DO62_777 [Burkholderia pseudomallei]